MTGDRQLDIRDLDQSEIGVFFQKHGEKLFRAGQVYEWLWKRGCRSFDEMTNLPKSVRGLLDNHFSFHVANPDVEQQSADGTVKVGFRLHDDLIAEGVLIPSEDRFTACVSSQVGCALGCSFCATGKLGFSRNLSAGEIFDQVVYITSLAGRNQKTTDVGLPARPLSNIVFMGMGEPFLNYENVKGSIEKITAVDGLGMSPQRITVSSIGIPKMIRKMAEENPRWHFALSLHAATDEKRDQLVPFSAKHPLKEIIDALKFYVKLTGKRFTIEYILFRNINDNLSDARDLAVFCKNFPVKINLIEYNEVAGIDYARPDVAKVRAFKQFLESRNLVVNLRKSKGKDIDAACGQLAGRILPNRKGQE